jgi:hypothetical protein
MTLNQQVRRMKICLKNVYMWIYGVIVTQHIVFEREKKGKFATAEAKKNVP